MFSHAHGNADAAANHRSSIVAAALLLMGLACGLLVLGARSTAGQGFVVAFAGLAALVTMAFDRRRDGDWPDLPPARSTLALLMLPAMALFPFLPRLMTGTLAMPIAEALGSLFLTVAYVLWFVVAWRATSTSRGIEILTVSLVLIGLAEATYGVFNLLGGNDYLLYFRRWAYHDSATGTLVNRNHFAYLLELTIPLAIALALAAREDSVGGRIEAAENSARRMLWVIAAAVMLLGLLASRSRMGMASLLTSSLLVLAVARSMRPRSAPKRAGASGLVLTIFALTAVFVSAVGADLVFDRFATTGRDLEGGRLPIWQDTLTMIRASPMVGAGLGSYEHLITGYRAHPTPTPFAHAHSDYLEVLADNGILGLAVVVGWVTLFARRLVRTLRRRMSDSRRSYVVATAIGITSIILHSTVDFGLRIPAVALTLLLVIVLFLRASNDPALAAGEGGRA